VVVCSDDWKGLKKIPPKHLGIIPCKVGSYISTGFSLNGKPKLRQMTTKEMEQMGATDSKPCDCVVCRKRRENSTKIAPAAGLRSGKKLGWDKYGPPRTL
jgi:hypothetical protein